MSQGPTQLERILKAIAEGEPSPVYLVVGDRVLSEPAAERIAAALATSSTASISRYHRPPGLLPLLADLRTYSLFEAAKITLVIDSGVVADRKAAVEFIDEVTSVLPVGGDGELSERQAEAAGRLLEALRLFGVDPGRGGAEEVVAELPDWVLSGSNGRRKKQQRETLRGELAHLLGLARAAELQGWVASDLAELMSIVNLGLPSGHVLILAESHVARDHPLVAALAERGALIELESVTADRGGRWNGLEALASELASETGATIGRDALAELARRTLRQEDGRSTNADTNSTSRFAGEYRKLADICSGGRISLEDVKRSVGDRGEEDVWQILDAIGAGKPDAALQRYRRYLAAASDPLAARLSFFSLLASFVRHLVAISGMMKLTDLAPGMTSYARFKAHFADRLTAPPAAGMENPLAGIHPYRLHRAYLAASRLPDALFPGLPAMVFETERAIKGDSSEPDAAVTRLLATLATGSSVPPLYR